MMNTNKPTRDQLQMVFKDHRLVIAFESLFEDTAVSIPAVINDLSLEMCAAESRATQALDALSRIANALEMLATAPVQIEGIKSNEFVPTSVVNADAQTFLPIVPEYIDEASYGSFYATNIALVVAVAAPNTAYEVGSSMTTGTALRLMSFGGAHYLQLERNGVYLVNWSMTIDTAIAGDAIEGGFMVDGTASEIGTAHTSVAAAAAASTISSSAVMPLSALNQLSLYVRNHTAARDIEVQHASLTATLIRRLS